MAAPRPQAPPPPPPRPVRPTTGTAALVLASVAVGGWLVSAAITWAFGMVAVNGKSNASYLRQSHGTATLLALLLLAAAAAMYLVPLVRHARADRVDPIPSDELQ